MNILRSLMMVVVVAASACSPNETDNTVEAPADEASVTSQVIIIDDIQSRLESLESIVSELVDGSDSGGLTSPSQLTTRIDGLDELVADLADDLADERSARLEFGGQIDGLEGDLRASIADLRDMMNELRALIEDLEIRYEILQMRIDQMQQ
ncbi:MAG: hypothetical protein WD007_02175 [Nitriliruptoraceae bacterium]